jgi:hypothetical protein
VLRPLKPAISLVFIDLQQSRAATLFTICIPRQGPVEKIFQLVQSFQKTPHLVRLANDKVYPVSYFGVTPETRCQDKNLDNGATTND